MQNFKFIIEEKERAHGLAAILLDLIPTAGLRIENRGGARSKTRSIDFAVYEIFYDNRAAGKFEYTLTQGVYECAINLDGVPKEKYEQIIGVVRERFPEISS